MSLRRRRSRSTCRPTPWRVFAAIHALNGNGEMTGSHWIAHHGAFVGPELITDTHAVGACLF